MRKLKEALGNFKRLDNKRQLLTLVILILGLIVAVILVGQRQLFEKKAQEDLYSAFEVTDDEGNPISCTGDTCETETLEVEIKVKDVEKLLIND